MSGPPIDPDSTDDARMETRSVSTLQFTVMGQSAVHQRRFGIQA